MKKTLIIIFSIILCIALTGAAVALGGEGGIIKKDEPVSQTENEAQSSAQKEEKLEQTETLSAEDKALKAEIAKISDTKVDFRVNKVQKFENESYSLTYKEIDPLFTGKGEEKLIYTGKTADGYDVSFKYNVKDGNLFVARWESPKIENQDSDITLEQCENIAKKYANMYCDLNVYTLSYTKEYDESFAFVFTKYISGYETCDQVDVEVNKQGKIIYLRINTDVFENENIQIEEKIILAKLDKMINPSNASNFEYSITRKRITLSDSRPVMECYVEIKGQYHNSHMIYQVPLE